LKSAAKGASDLRDSLEDPLLILLSIVGILLLIACANVANLLLARAVARQREIAVRLAIGGQPLRRSFASLVTESLVLAYAGGAIGILLSWWIASALLAGSPDLPHQLHPPIRGFFAFTFTLSLVTGLLFGLIPAWQATSPQLALNLEGSGRQHLRKSRPRPVLRKALGRGHRSRLSSPDADRQRSLHPLAPQTSRNVDLGFNRDRLLSFALEPSLAGYKPEPRPSVRRGPAVSGHIRRRCAQRRGRRECRHHGRPEYEHYQPRRLPAQGPMRI